MRSLAVRVRRTWTIGRLTGRLHNPEGGLFSAEGHASQLHRSHVQALDQGCHSWETARASVSKTSVTRAPPAIRGRPNVRTSRDRKSTRLNSSHLVISYAVFCLK